MLDVVDSIPPGRVMSYGDIAEYLGDGPGPRQVGRVMAVYGGAVAWWRVIHSDGTPAPGHDSGRSSTTWPKVRRSARPARPSGWTCAGPAGPGPTGPSAAVVLTAPPPRPLRAP